MKFTMSQNARMSLKFSLQARGELLVLSKHSELIKRLDAVASPTIPTNLRRVPPPASHGRRCVTTCYHKMWCLHAVADGGHGTL